jgi:hypothetical protein
VGGADSMKYELQVAAALLAIGMIVGASAVASFYMWVFFICFCVRQGIKLGWL